MSKSGERGGDATRIVVGPVHAGIIEPGQFAFTSGGETVERLEVRLGYAHRGVERHCEGMGVMQAARSLARVCGACSVARSLAYACGAETLAEIALPEEIAWARVILAELERTYNHLGDLAMCASGAGWMPGFTRGMTLKERVARICGLVAGHRYLFDAIVPGGIARGALVERETFARELEALELEIERFLVALFANGSVRSRWRGSGVVHAEVAREGGAVGPAHRASGGSSDMRADAPYAAYAALRVRAVTEHRGDVLARCAVKRVELESSLCMIREACRALGAARLPVPLAVQPRAGTASVTVEGPRGAETVTQVVGADGCLTRVRLFTASERNWPLVARAMEGNIVPDFPLVNKSFNLCYACADK